MDFRDHHIKKALDETVSAYRPERGPRSRARRIAAVVALTAAVCVAFWSMLHYSAPRPARPPAAGQPIPVQLLPAPAGTAAPGKN